MRAWLEEGFVAESRARRRACRSQPKVRLSRQRLGWTRKPLGAGSERWMNSRRRPGWAAWARRSSGRGPPAEPASAPSSSSRGWVRRMPGKTSRAPARSDDAGRGDHHAQQPAQGIYHPRPFSPSDLVACIVAAHSGVRSHLNARRVFRAQHWGLFFSALPADLVPQRVVELRPKSALPPAGKGAGNQAPVRQVVREERPRAAAAKAADDQGARW